MPSSITHAYIAKDVYKNLTKKVKIKFKDIYIEDYKTYAQGPDIFYFYNIILPITKKSRDIIRFGHYIHNNKVNEFFINLCDKVKSSQDIDQFAFLCGLVTHYQADSIIHPYINYKATIMRKKNLTRKDVHFILETYLDNYFITKNEKIEYKKFKVHEFCFNLNKKDSVINLLNNSIKEVFDKENMGESYFKSLKDMKNFFKYLRYDPTGIKRELYRIINIFASRCFRDVRYLSYNFNLENDDVYLNLKKKIWYNLDSKGLKSNESLLELYDKVIYKTKNMIEELYEYVYENKDINLEKLFGNKSYSNGLELK